MEAGGCHRGKLERTKSRTSVGRNEINQDRKPCRLTEEAGINKPEGEKKKYAYLIEGVFCLPRSAYIRLHRMTTADITKPERGWGCGECMFLLSFLTASYVTPSCGCYLIR